MSIYILLNYYYNKNMENIFYDGTKLLSLTDINGNKPEIYICTSNRSGGKTTYFNSWAVRRFINHKEKFALLYRYAYEIDDVSDKFFKDIESLFFQGYVMTSEPRAKGTFRELFLNGESCGYAISLNKADALKKFSHLLSDTQRILFDEFQSENNQYLPNEVGKLLSIHTSIARGQGKQVRYLPIYMISNPVSIINPYYTALGISTRLDDKTRFLKGDGFVMEQGYNENASKMQKQSAFNRAFASNDYLAYTSEGVYLNDNSSFIESLKGKNTYLATLKYGNKEYALRSYDEQGIIYCDNRVDSTFKYKIAITTGDHEINYVLLKNNDFFIQQLKWYFSKGCLRFRNLECKNVIFTLLSL